MTVDPTLTTSIDALAEPLREMRLRFEAILEPHREALWNFCRRLTGSSWDAEDLVQESLLKAFASLPNVWQPLEGRTYLFRIAANAWVDQVRRDRRAPIDDLEAHPELQAPEATDRRAALHDAMERLVHVLPPRQRVVLLLCDSLDFRAREVAAMLATTEGAVKAALHRARASLAKAATVPPLRTALDRRDATDPIVTRYVEAFDRRDPDAIAALLHEDAVVTIVGCAEEFGRAAARPNSLHEWAVDPRPQWIEPGVLEGRPALFVFYRRPEAERALGWITTLETDTEGILAQRQYYFTPEFIRHAATLLGVPAMTHGHQYTGTDARA